MRARGTRAIATAPDACEPSDGGSDLCLARSCYGACRRERAVPERFGGKSTTLKALLTLPRPAEAAGAGQDAEEPACYIQPSPVGDPSAEAVRATVGKCVCGRRE